MPLSKSRSEPTCTISRTLTAWPVPTPDGRPDSRLAAWPESQGRRDEMEAGSAKERCMPRRPGCPRSGRASSHPTPCTSIQAARKGAAHAERAKEGPWGARCHPPTWRASKEDADGSTVRLDGAPQASASSSWSATSRAQLYTSTHLHCIHLSGAAALRPYTGSSTSRMGRRSTGRAQGR